jgi:pilus assembly protein FimV
LATKINKNKVIEAAQKYVQKGQYDKAIKEYARLVEEDPRDVRIWLKIGDLHAKKNSTNEAIETYSKVAEFYSEQGFFLKAVAVYKQILKINGNLVEMNLKLAELYKQLGLLSDAMHQYEQVSNYYSQAGRTKEALAALRQIVDLDPENVASRIKLAELYSKEGMKDEAAEAFSKAADFLRAENRLDDFVKVAERLVFHQPDNIVLTKELSGIYLRKRDPRRALQKLQLSFKADPRDEETLEMLAQAFEDLGQVQKTISVLKELTRIHAENGLEKKQREIYERILSLAPHDDEAKKALATLRGGNAAEAPRERIAQQSAIPEPEVYQEQVPDPNEGYYHEDSSSYEAQAAHYQGDPHFVAAAQDPYQAPEHLEEVSAQQFDQLNQYDFPEDDSVPDPAAPDSFNRSAAMAPRFNDEVAKILTEADVYIKYGLHEKAVEHLRQIFSRDPDNAEVHHKLKDLYLQLGRFQEASRELLYLGRLCLSTDPQLAADYFSQVLELDSDNREARSLLESLAGSTPAEPLEAELLSDSFSDVPIDLAADDIVEEIPIDADDLMVSDHGFAEDEQRSARYQDESYSSEYQKDYSTQQQPDLGSSSERMASSGIIELYGETRDSQGSPMASSEVIELGVDHTPSLSRIKAHAEEEISGIDDDLEEVDFFIQQSFFGEARNILQELLERFPDHPLVTAKMKELQSMEAKVMASRSPSDTRHEAVPSELANELAAEFDDMDVVEIAPEVGLDYSVQDVFNDFKRGVSSQVSDEDSDTHYDLGIAYREMGLLDDAIAEFKVAMRSREKEVLCHMMIGLCFMEKDLFSEAISQFKTGLYVEGITDRETIALYFELGQAYERLEDIREALYYYEKVAKKDTRFRDVSTKISKLSQELGDEEDGGGERSDGLGGQGTFPN